MAATYGTQARPPTRTVSGMEVIVDLSRGSWMPPTRGLGSCHAPISRPHAADPRPRSRAEGPHRDGNLIVVRGADALRPRRRLSAPDDQEAALAFDHRRAAVVPARRHQRPLAE